MRNTIYIIFAATVLLTSCVTPIKKSVAYKGMYSEKPLSVLLMPPINKTSNVEAKEYFHATLMVPLADKGFYIIPPFLSMEVLKRESAYDAELFINSSSAKFGEVFGADVALFTIIHRWEKKVNKVIVEVEYIVKSTKTNEILYTRRGTIIKNTTTDTGNVLTSIAVTALKTAVANYSDVAKACNAVTFSDIPVGKYSPVNPKEKDQPAGQKTFKMTIK
jgi:hypothetical protein